MPKIQKNVIDKILEVAKIEEVVQDCLGRYSSSNKAGLKKAGVRYKALCPFHDDKNMGSFIVYPKGNCYKCFSCGASGGVVEFLMEREGLSFPDAIRWLGKKYNIEVDHVEVDWTYTPKPAPPPLPMLELPMAMVKRTMDAIHTNEIIKDNLVNWMFSVKWDPVQFHRLAPNLYNYCVGHGKNGHTIFWQIDENGKVRTGKMMKYRTDGHRDKVASWNFDYIHATLCRHWDAERQEMTDEPPYPYPNIYNPDEQEPCLCFFGLHLLNIYPKAVIKIVESEKTAILMATAYGNHAQQLWMACGGLEMLTRERMKPLIDQGRQIILYPDRDGIDKWRVKAEQMHYSKLKVDTTPVTKWWRPEDGEKADIADVVIRMISERATTRPMTTIEDVKQQIPQITPMIENFNLIIHNG
jgi:hypothetical protein